MSQQQSATMSQQQSVTMSQQQSASMSQQQSASMSDSPQGCQQQQSNQVKQTVPASSGIQVPHQQQQQQTPAPPPVPTTQPSSLTCLSSAGAQYVVEEEMTTVKVPMLRPRPALLRVLHLAGGVGETFTLGEIINHVKDYIRERTLYDEQDPRIVHCSRDLLGAALGVETFTVHDAINLFRKNCTMEPDSCIRVYRHLVTRPVSCQPQVSTAAAAAPHTTAVSHTTTASAAASHTTAAEQPTPTESTTATSASVSSCFQRTTQQRTPELSTHRSAETVNTQPEPSSSSTSTVIKFQAAQSYVTVADSDLDEKSARKQMASADSSSDSGRKNGCLPEKQRPEKTGSRRRRQSTSINVTYDEPDGVAGPWTCEVMMETSPGEMVTAEDDTVVVEFDSNAFSVEYEVDSDSDTEAGEIKLTENSSDESSSTLEAAVLVVCAESDIEYLADYSDSDSGTDAELADADKWLCEHCQKKNPPFHRNCGGCWSLRPDWLPSTTKVAQDGACADPQDTLTKSLHSEKSDSQQSLSQQSLSQQSLSQQSPSQLMSRDLLQSSPEQKCDRLELNHSPAEKDRNVVRKRKCSSSLSTSDSQEGKVSDKMEPLKQRNPGICCKCKPVDKIKSVGVASSKDDWCVVCLTRKKTASIVHGKTGHQACCYRCATRLKQKRKPCPICRRPIQKVIRNFHV
ncbi:hypothetical protein BsWGS_27821 [Bradybaena similaris]